MSDNKNSKAIPGWVNFLFWGALAAGVLYAIFSQGFLNQPAAVSVRDEMGQRYVVPSIDIIPVRDAAAIEAGKETYGNVCAACHGGDMKGGVGPNLTDPQWLHQPATETNLAKLVMNGISAGETLAPSKVPMPARGGQPLSNEEVWQVIYYLSDTNGNIEQDAVPTGQ
ncbi:MAG: cytochrome c [Leptospiraceae bacterium]|nr:cytochrome c [Leptospiraceae bacterium]